MSRKPWLACIPAKSIKLDNLKKQFTIEDSEELQGDAAVAFRAEVQYIQKKVEPKRHIMREKKTDEALLEDARFYNKHTDYLLNLMKKRTVYERLGLRDASLIQGLTKAQLKKSYHKMALIWHPDSIKKAHKYCFANEQAYTTLVNEAFQLIEEAYRNLLQKHFSS